MTGYERVERARTADFQASDESTRLTVDSKRPRSVKVRSRAEVTAPDPPDLSPEASFDDFVIRSRTHLLSYIHALTGDIQASQDIAQETFIRAWKKWPVLHRYENPEAWSRHVAHNLSVGLWRRRLSARRGRGVEPEPVGEPEIGHLDIAVALRHLPKDQRNAVIMHGVLDMSSEQIASELRVPVGTVKSWISRGKSSLRSRLDIQEEGTDQAQGKG
jgi:RNA polymerase sigma-70 factor (ECF subfamily)